MYDTLIQSDTLYTYGRVSEGTRTVGVGFRKKQKDLSASEREECGYGRVWGSTLYTWYISLL